MAGYFCDSSAIAKRYISETGTSWIIGLMRLAAKNEIAVAQITGVEVVSAISRRHRGNFLTTAQADKAIHRFLRDFNNSFGVIKINDSIIRNAIYLAQTHVLRGYDAVQLASAIALNTKLSKLGLPAFIFVSADNNLNSAANAEGLAVDNPNNH
ncbi:MAG: type II toxin-antitoxin system VapC family toxin [Pyrinomonadaceae bacterium]|nr:type II toxin-antitoxin system VapC family toxin [Pyrinomonadaceae bacterium]